MEASEGEIEWIPISTQLGFNEVVIAVVEEKQSYIYGLKIFINSSPIISYSPDNTEYIELGETFTFQLQSFDENDNQKLFWDLTEKPETMELNKQEAKTIRHT